MECTPSSDNTYTTSRILALEQAGFELTSVGQPREQLYYNARQPVSNTISFLLAFFSKELAIYIIPWG